MTALFSYVYFGVRQTLEEYTFVSCSPTRATTRRSLTMENGLKVNGERASLKNIPAQPRVYRPWWRQ